jgi:hypothetical protein
LLNHDCSGRQSFSQLTRLGFVCSQKGDDRGGSCFHLLKTPVTDIDLFHLSRAIFSVAFWIPFSRIGIESFWGICGFLKRVACFSASRTNSAHFWSKIGIGVGATEASG